MNICKDCQHCFNKLYRETCRDSSTCTAIEYVQSICPVSGLMVTHTPLCITINPTGECKSYKQKDIS